MGDKWQTYEGLPPGMTIDDLGDLSDNVRTYVDQKLTPRTQYDQMREDSRAKSWYQQAYSGLASGITRGIDTIGQIGAETQEAVGLLPEGSADTYKAGLRKREAQRDAIESGLPWGAKGAAMVGEAVADPTTYIPGGRQAGWLKRAWDNAWRGGSGSFFGVPAVSEGDTATEKIVGAGFGSIASTLGGEVINQAGKRGGTGIFNTAEGLYQGFAEKILRQAKSRLGKDARFFDKQGKPTIEFMTELHESGRPWLNMSRQEQDAIRQTASYLTTDPLPKTAAQVARMRDFQDTGISPAVPHIIRSQKNWGEWDRISKDEVGGEAVRAHFHKNQLEIEDFDKGFQVRLGGKTKTNYQTGESIFDTVWDFYKAKDEEISKVYRRIREEKGDYTVRPSELQDGINYWWSEGDQLTGGVGSNIKKQLETWGILDKQGRYLRGMTVTEAENIRKRLNQRWKGANASQREAIRDLKNRIDDDVINGTGSDSYKEGRDLHRAFMEEIDGTASGKNTLIRNILDGRVKLEDVPKQVLNGGVDDFKLLKAFILKSENGAQTFNDLRTNIWKEAFRKGKNNLSNVTEGDVKIGSDGVEIFSAPAAAKYIRENLPPELREQLFTPSENSLIDAFIRVTSKHMMPPRGSVNYSNTAAAIGEMFKGMGGIQGYKSPVFYLRKIVGAFKDEAARNKARAEGRKMTNPVAHMDEMLKRDRTLSRQQKIGDALQASPLAPVTGRETSSATEIPAMASIGVKYGREAYDKAKKLMRDLKLIERLRRAN